PVVHDAGQRRRRKTGLEKDRDRTEPRRIDNIQLAVVSEWVPNESAVTVRLRGRGIADLAFEDRPAQHVGAGLPAQQDSQISLALGQSRDRSDGRHSRYIRRGDIPENIRAREEESLVPAVVHLGNIDWTS